MLSRMISTHVLDLGHGTPAQGISVRLEKKTGSGTWSVIGEDLTDADGRIRYASKAEAGSYRLTFLIDKYFSKQNSGSPFLTEAVVAFQIEKTDRKYHIPLLLSPYGFSTYRGS